MVTEPLISETSEGVVVAEPEGPPSVKMSPTEWLHKRLFSSVFNSVATIVLGAVSIYLAYRFLRFVFVTGRWDPVRENLELFMIGTFPRDERWRVIGQLLVFSFGLGLVLGSLRSGRRDRAEETGEPFTTESWRTYAGSYWSVALFFFVVLAAFARTIGPWLLALGVIALITVGWFITGHFSRNLRALGWTLAGLAVVVSFQLLSGTGGWAWFYTTLVFIPLITDVIGRLDPERARLLSTIALVASIPIGVAGLVLSPNLFGLVPIALVGYEFWLYRQGDRLDSARVGLTMVVAAVVIVVYQLIDLSGIDWGVWSGFHLTLVVSVSAIALSFPLGVLLALGRRSSLPAIRYMSVVYIEFFRGAPLITFLLAAAFFLGFFLDTDNPLSLITRGVVAFTLFSAAYVAEIVRGGLQAVPPGQVEAGLASGLSQAKITRLIVLPQALRAVIPAMVGQFISLFKDTSLLGIIAITEFLDARLLVHAQEAFRGFGIAETLTFVAFGYWAFAFTMSRESQRLERRLGVGVR